MPHDSLLASAKCIQKDVYTIVTSRDIGVTSKEEMAVQAIFSRSKRPIIVSQDNLQLLPMIWRQLPHRQSRWEKHSMFVNKEKGLALLPHPFIETKSNWVTLVTVEDIDRCHGAPQEVVEWSDSCFGVQYPKLNEAEFTDLIAQQCSKLL